MMVQLMCAPESDPGLRQSGNTFELVVSAPGWASWCTWLSGRGDLD